MLPRSSLEPPKTVSVRLSWQQSASLKDDSLWFSALSTVRALPLTAQVRYALQNGVPGFLVPAQHLPQNSNVRLGIDVREKIRKHILSVFKQLKYPRSHPKGFRFLRFKPFR